MLLAFLFIFASSAFAQTLSPTALSFGNQVVGQTSAPKTTTFRNNTGAPLRINSIAMIGTNAADFEVTSNCPIAPTQLLAGDNCVLSVTLTASALGPRTGTLRIRHSTAASPQTVALTGTGVDPVKLTPPTFSFGNQALGTTSGPKTATLTNVQAAPLTITNVVFSVGFVAAGGTCPTTPDTLAGGASCTILAAFAPSVLGAANGTMVVSHSASNSPQTVGLSGAGIAPVTLSTASLSFGNTAVGNASAPKTVTLTNKKNVALNFGSIVTVGDFAITSNTCGASIAAGANCQIDVKFAPTAVGQLAGTLTFTDDAANSPQVVNLSGAGILGVKATPATQTFSARSVGTTSAPQNVTVTNNLTSPITVTGATTTGDFAVASNSCGTLAPAGTCVIGVTFTPTAVGARAGTLSINHSAFGAPAVVTLSGTGNANGLTSIAVTPVNTSLALGLTRQFTATGTFTGPARTANITTSVTWTSSVSSVASLSSVPGTEGVATSTGVGTTVVRGTYGTISGSTNLTVTPATLVSIAVTPSTPSIALGTSQQFTATGTYTNGSTVNLTNSITWTSSVPSAASINSAGLATSAGVGSTDIRATSGSITGTTTLTVSPAALVSISVTPLNPTVAKGLKQQFHASGLFTDGTTQDLTSSATWSSSIPAVGTIDAAGLATALNAGATFIAATAGTVSGQTTLTVGPATLISIAVTPVDASIALGTKQQYSATGTYTDGSTQDLTASVAWSSSDPAVATIDAAGLATSAATGTTVITATSGAVAGSTNLTVSPAALLTIAVTPAIPSIALGRTQQFTATGTFTDGTIQDITNAVTWSSSNGAVATISMSPGTSGLATSLAVGPTTIAAASGGVSGSTTLTVTPAVIAGITVSPSPLSLAKGTSHQLSATATYSDGTTSDVSSTATWSSSDTSVVGVSSTGLATAVAVGTADVSATEDSVTGYTAGQVSAALLTAIAITPSAASIPLGTTQQFSAQGTYTDGSTQDVTGTAHWSSSDGTIATLSNAPATAGLATSVAVESVTVTAAIGSISSTASLTVTPAALVSIDVTPAAATIPLGSAQQFAATGTYTDGTTRDITTSVTWSTSLATVAIVSNAVGSEGLATSSGTGTATITATLGAITGSAALTVASAQIVSIAVNPSSATISVGQIQLFVATATYTDGSTADVTTAATWSSSSSGVATIDASGNATAVAAGSATITATSGSVHGDATLSVVALPSISSFTASPDTVTTGASSTLTSVFSGGTGVISPGNISVSSGSSVSVTPASTTTYTLTVTNSVGRTTSATTTVTVVPAPVITSFTAAAATITAGTSTSLTGVFANGTGVVTPGGLAVTSGSPVTVTPSASTTYTLTVTNAAGTSATSTVSVVVVAAPVITSFSAVPASVKQGASSGLTAVFANGTGTVDNGVGAVSSGVTKTVTPAVTTTYTLTVTNAAGTSATATATVNVAFLQSIAIVPTTATIPVGSQGRFTATGTYSDASTANVSNQVTWTSSDTSFATVNSTGLVTGVGSGTVTITASLGSVTGTATITVTAVSGAAARFVYGGVNTGVVGYIVDQATGGLTGVPGGPVVNGSGFTTYSVTTDPTGRLVYSGSDLGIFVFTSNAVTGQLTNAIPAGGLEQTRGYGVTATNSANPTYRGMAMDPSGRFLFAIRGSVALLDAYLVDGGNGGLTLMASYATGTTPRAVTVDPTGKYVYVANLNSSTVSAYLVNETTGALTPVAGSPFASISNPRALAIDPSGHHLYVGGSNGGVAAYTIATTSGALTAVSGSPFAMDGCCVSDGGVAIEPTGRFLYAQNSSTGKITGFGIDQVSGALTAVSGSPFTSDVASLLVVDGSGRFVYVTRQVAGGGVVALSINQTTGALTAVSGSPFGGPSFVQGLVAPAVGAVSTATLVSLALEPSPLTITTSQLGGRTQLRVIGTYSDGTTRSLTESASWSGSPAGIVTLSNVPGTKGLVTSTAYGSTVVTATYSGFTASGTLTVQQPAIASIAVTPTSPTIASGTAIQFTAVATYSDGSTQNVTALATWTSSDLAVATVSNTAGSQGLSTAIAAGTSTITATYTGVTGTATITVQ